MLSYASTQMAVRIMGACRVKIPQERGGGRTRALVILASGAYTDSIAALATHLQRLPRTDAHTSVPVPKFSTTSLIRKLISRHSPSGAEQQEALFLSAINMAKKQDCAALLRLIVEAAVVLEVGLFSCTSVSDRMDAADQGYLLEWVNATHKSVWCTLHSVPAAKSPRLHCVR